MPQRTNRGDYPYRKKVNATGSRLHNNDKGENTDVARAIEKFDLNISEPILDDTAKKYAIVLDDSKFSGAVDVATWSGIARQRDLWTQELRSQGVVSPDFIPTVDAGMNAVIWGLLNLMAIDNVVGYAIYVFTHDSTNPDDTGPFGVNIPVATYKTYHTNNPSIFPTPFQFIPDGIPQFQQSGFPSTWSDTDLIGYFSVEVPIQGGGTPSTQPSPTDLVNAAIDFAEIAALVGLPELIAPEAIAGELLGTEAPFIFGPLTGSPVELPLIGSPLVALPPANVRLFLSDGVTPIAPTVSRMFNNDSGTPYHSGTAPDGKRFLGYDTKFVLPESALPVIDQPPFIPPVPNCCGGSTISPILGGGSIITLPGPYTPPFIPPPLPPSGSPTEPPITPNPNGVIDTMFTCGAAYTNSGANIAPNLDLVSIGLVNVGGGIQTVISNAGASMTPPLNTTCDEVVAVIVAFKFERLVNASGWPNLNNSIFSRPVKVLMFDGTNFNYLFEPRPDGSVNYSNVPTIGFTSTDESYVIGDKYLVPVASWAAIGGINLDGLFVYIDNGTVVGLTMYACGIRRIPSDKGLPERCPVELVPVGQHLQDITIPEHNQLVGTGYIKETNGLLSAVDYQTGLETHQPICSRGTRTSVTVNLARQFHGTTAGTHTYTGSFVIAIDLKDNFNAPIGSSGGTYRPVHTFANAESMTTSDVFDLSAVDWTQVYGIQIFISACDEGQNAGSVYLYYANCYWS